MTGQPANSVEDVFRQLERRLVSTERRAVPRAASDLLGPGYAPRAVQTFDWNSEECSFAGQFWSDVGSLNGPDPGVEWIGITMGEEEHWVGVQRVWSTGAPQNNPDLREMTRRWWSNDGGATRTYGPWVGDYPWAAVPTLAAVAQDPDQPFEFCMKGNGEVWMRGYLRNPSGTNWTASTSYLVADAGALPILFRPKIRHAKIIGTGGALIGRVFIYADGSINVSTYSDPGSYMEMEDIHFLSGAVSSR